MRPVWSQFEHAPCFVAMPKSDNDRMMRPFLLAPPDTSRHAVPAGPVAQHPHLTPRATSSTGYSKSALRLLLELDAAAVGLRDRLGVGMHDALFRRVVLIFGSLLPYATPCSSLAYAAHDTAAARNSSATCPTRSVPGAPAG